MFGPKLKWGGGEARAWLPSISNHFRKLGKSRYRRPHHFWSKLGQTPHLTFHNKTRATFRWRGNTARAGAGTSRFTPGGRSIRATSFRQRNEMVQQLCSLSGVANLMVVQNGFCIYFLRQTTSFFPDQFSQRIVYPSFKHAYY